MSNRRTPMFWYDNVDGELRANGYACKRSIRSAKTFAKNESMINLANMIKQEAMSFINENFSDTDAQALSTMFNQNETIKLSGYKEAGCEVREKKKGKNTFFECYYQASVKDEQVLNILLNQLNSLPQTEERDLLLEAINKKQNGE